MPYDSFLMKKLLKSGICGSMISTLMHCLLQKSQYLRLLFNKHYMNSNHVTPKRMKKKKRNKNAACETQTWVQWIQTYTIYILRDLFKWSVKTVTIDSYYNISQLKICRNKHYCSGFF